MKINTKHPNNVMGIIGLPRSGTTLFNSIINSYDNAFGLSEPHWNNVAARGLWRPDKVDINCNSTEHIMLNVKNYVEHTQYDLGAVKETFRIDEQNVSEYVIESDHVTHLVYMMRSPFDIFASWKARVRAGWPRKYTKTSYLIDNIEKLLDNMYQHSLGQDRFIYAISYDMLTRYKFHYLNEIMGSEFELPKIEWINPTRYFYGDPHANKGGRIKQKHRVLSILSDNEKKELQPVEDAYVAYLESWQQLMDQKIRERQQKAIDSPQE